MTNSPPFWTTKERKQTAYIWSHDGVERAGTLKDVARAIGTPTVASHNEVSNYEGEQASNDAPILNARVKTIEIVKRNGCYTVEEDGRLLTPNALTRDEQLLSNDDLQLFRGESSTDSLENAIRAAFESRKGGSSDGALNYTIGRPRVFQVESDAPEVSPLLLRVRLEEGELPPTRCRMTLRTVVIQGFDENTRLQQVVDHSVRELRDVPVSSAQDAKSTGLLLPYPASATVPLQTTLISKRRIRNQLDSIRGVYEDRFEDNKASRDRPRATWPMANNDPIINAFASVRRVVVQQGQTMISKAIMWSNMSQLLKKARSNSSYDYFTYGNALTSVFADLATDLDAISNVIERESEPAPGQGPKAQAIQYVHNLVQYPATEGIYKDLSQRQRELIEYIVGRPDRRNQAFEAVTAVNPGTTLAYPRTEAELNIANAQGMRKEHQMNHRIDTYIDIELWDPQYTDIIKMSIAPGLQAALEAGRLVQCEGAKLQQDFNKMVGAASRLARVSEKPYALKFSPNTFGEGEAADTGGKPASLGKLMAEPLRRLLDLPAAPPVVPFPKAAEEAGLARAAAAKVRAAAAWAGLARAAAPAPAPDAPQELIPADWYSLPFFRQSTILRSEFNLREFQAYTPMEDYTSSTSGNRFLVRGLPQLVGPVKTMFGTQLYDALTDTDVSSEGKRFYLKHTMASGYKLRRIMDKALDATVFRELSTSTAPGQPPMQRLLFYTIYEIDGSQDINLVMRELRQIHDASVRSTLPFSPVYPNEVSIHIGMAFVALGSELSDQLQLVTGHSDDNVDVLSKMEAAEAFAAIITNVLGSRSTTLLTTNDLTESVMRKAKQEALRAASLIETIFAQEDAAMINFNDPLLWLARGSAAALVALNHCTCWHTQWNLAAVIQGRSVWKRQILSFSRALKQTASSRNPSIQNMPYLNIQSNWISHRVLLPTDESAVNSVILQTQQSADRVRAIALKLHSTTEPATEPTALVTTALAIAIEDVVLSLPLVWRLTDNKINEVLSSRQTVQQQNLHVRSISQEELTHSWARRRLNVEDQRLEADAFNTDVDSLSTALAKCDVSDTIDDFCLYYTPMCCETLPRMQTSYDPMLSQQMVLLGHLETSLDSLNKRVSHIGGDKDFSADALKVTIVGAYDEYRRPSHPLLIRSMQGGKAIDVHVSPQLNDLTQMFKRHNPPGVDRYKDDDTITKLIDTLRNSTPLTTYDEECNYLHDARRCLLFAIDRVYQSLLYARSVYYSGAVVVGIDLTKMPLPASEPVCPGWPPGAPQPTTLVYSSTYPFADKSAARESHLRMLTLALLTATALLPRELSEDMSFTIKTESSNSGNIHQSVVKTADKFVSALSGIKDSHVLLGELVACLTHACFKV